jgi:3-oxoacyl-[acyl-carrier-protein] synthase-3
MSFSQVNNVHIKGIAACIPENLITISSLDIFNQKEADTFTKNTGIYQKHIVPNEQMCASDLCFKAAEDIIQKLNWKKEEIDILIFISQTSDYVLPATSNILQHKLGLSNNCLCLDINLGCSAFIYGLNLIGNLLQNPSYKKAILLVGDTISQYSSPKDKSVYPLFGDAGTATAIEYDDSVPSIWSFILGTDGSGENAIKINNGGARNRTNLDSFNFYENELDASILKRNIDLNLNGVDIFNFAIKIVPSIVRDLLEKINLTTNEIDLLFLHQANLFLNETIRKKIKIDKDKTPYSIQNFGNTNGSSIPVTITDFFKDSSFDSNNNVLMSGFGVGLSWGIVHIETKFKIETNISYL